MTLSRCYNIEDLRKAAQRRLPKGLFEFIDRATEDDIALRRNRAGFEKLQLLPKAMVDVSRRTTVAHLFGKAHSMPLAVSPCGPAGFFWYKGELALARAAAKAQVPYTLSTYSTTEMAEIAETGVTPWLQLYLWNDRSISYGLVEKAISMDFEALVVTIDTPVLGQREYLHRNGFLPPFHASTKALLDMLWHPRWLAGVPMKYLLGPGWPRVVNIPKAMDSGSGSQAEIQSRVALSQTTTWDDLSYLRDMWPRKLIIKGILRPEDADKACEIGCDAVLVSNHGGRNLDTAVSPIDVLPQIVEVVGGRAAVMLDSGVRRGSDIAKAVALGASAVMVGRPALYGVAVAGEEGALHALRLLQSELDRTMALIGCPSVEHITADFVV